MTVVVLDKDAVGDGDGGLLLGLTLTVGLEDVIVGTLNALAFLDDVTVQAVGDQFPALTLGVRVVTSNTGITSTIDESGAIGV